MTHTASVYPSLKGQFEVQTVDTPEPRENEVLIKTQYAALNPVDYKIQRVGRFFDTFPRVLGGDVSGTIAKVGSGVSNLKEGDKVTAFLPLFAPEPSTRVGGFQEYTIARVPAIAKVPDNVSLADASTIPLAFSTAVDGLDYLGLDLKQLKSEPAPKRDDDILLIWGGASSVGQYAVQLANFLGYKVITTASARHHESLKSLGADVTLDYNKPDINDAVVAALNGAPLKSVYDSIATEDVIKAVHEILAKANKGNSAGAKTAFTAQTPETVNVTWDQGEWRRVFAATVQTDKSALGQFTFNWLTGVLESGKFKTNPSKVSFKGVENAQKAIDDYAENGTSGVKLVLQVA